MHHFFSAHRMIPVGIATVVALLAADIGLRVFTPGKREAQQSTMAAVHKADVRAAGVLRVSTASGAIADSVEKNTRRHAVLRRVDESAASTYLASMLPQVDSSIRRWPDERIRRPLRVALSRGPGVDGYRDAYAAAVSWAVTRWNGAALPVQFEFRGADTAGADIIVSWVPVLDSGRTGKADVTWDQRQYIRRAAITLATHTPDGRLLTAPEMTALALHELGHTIGLAHSTDEKDALFPMTRSADLTARDRATARLLYELPPGSLRN